MPRKRLPPEERGDQKLTETQLFTALDLRKAGMTTNKIAFLMKVNKSRIKKAFRKIEADKQGDLL